MYDLVDIGANLAHDSFDHDRAAVLARASDAGVGRLVVTGASVTSSAAALALAEAHPRRLFATVGVHPHHAADYDGHTSGALRALLGNRAAVAVGECGLDFFRDFSPRDKQREAFASQLEIAADVGKPVFLHQRDAHEDFLDILAPQMPRLTGGGVAHCFTGGVEEARAYLDLGLYIGVTGWVCDERRGAALRSALPTIPLDRLLIETDAPYLLPREVTPKPPHRRNEPAFLTHVLERVAVERGESAATVAAATTRNAVQLFRLNA